MVSPSIQYLALLQHADSVFPSGTVSFSWGLEALVNRGYVKNRKELTEFVSSQLTGRWANLDRSIMVHAMRAEGDMAQLTHLDAILDAQSLGFEQRTGTTRMGAAFLSVHSKLGSPLAAEIQQAVSENMLKGHAPVVQGAIWNGLGFGEDEAQVMAAHGLCTCLLGAAVRLSVVGHVDAQATHTDLRPTIDSILATSVCAPDQAHGFTPQTDIASMLHETEEMRLFVN